MPEVSSILVGLAYFVHGLGWLQMELENLDTHSFSNLRSRGGISSQALLVVKRAEGGSVSFGPVSAM